MRVSLTSFAAIPVLAAALLAPARSADAAVITLQFTGTYDTYYDVIFGERGTAVPFSYSLTYDTALDTDAQVYAAGSMVGSYTLANDLHGYSASGIVAAELTFGTHTWTTADLVPRTIADATADFFLDTDLNVAAPTASYIRFGDSAGFILLGATASAGDVLWLRSVSMVGDSSTNGDGLGPLTITTIPAAPVVPEPTSMVLLGTGLVTLIVRRRSRPWC